MQSVKAQTGRQIVGQVPSIPQNQTEQQTDGAFWCHCLPSFSYESVVGCAVCVILFLQSMFCTLKCISWENGWRAPYSPCGTLTPNIIAHDTRMVSHGCLLHHCTHCGGSVISLFPFFFFYRAISLNMWVQPWSQGGLSVQAAGHSQIWIKNFKGINI